MVGEFVGKDSQNGIYFSGMHGSRRVEVNGDQLFADFGVAQPETSEFAAPAHSPPQRPEFESGKSKHCLRPRKKMFHQRFMFWIEDIYKKDFQRRNYITL